jgi:hypothetical protein
MKWKYTYLYIIFFNVQFISAFSYKAHLYLGNLTENYLKQYDYTMYFNIITLLNKQSISRSSVWADSIKRQKDYIWSKTLHYEDILICNRTDKNIIPLYCGEKCIYTAILNMTNALKYNREYSKQININENLKFLIHFLQDLFQPLHIYGPYRGGNDYPIELYIKDKKYMTNMHVLWDSYIPEYFIKNHAKINFKSIYVKKINNIYDFQDILTHTMQKNLKLICKMNPYSTFYNKNNTSNKHNTDNIDKYMILPHIINFDDVYDYYIMKKLFYHYLTFSLSTLYFIFN